VSEQDPGQPEETPAEETPAVVVQAQAATASAAVPDPDPEGED
jgi:hypothetical protein